MQISQTHPFFKIVIPIITLSSKSSCMNKSPYIAVELGPVYMCLHVRFPLTFHTLLQLHFPPSPPFPITNHLFVFPSGHHFPPCPPAPVDGLPSTAPHQVFFPLHLYRYTSLSSPSICPDPPFQTLTTAKQWGKIKSTALQRTHV